MNKKKSSDFAISGGSPAFQKAIPSGQLYFPSWKRYEVSCRDIFERQYYTNQGPLVQKFELKLADLFKVKHVICVTNAAIGLIMAAESLGLKGKVIVPAFSFVGTAQSISWAGLEPVFCDVDPVTHQLSPEYVEPLIDSDVRAILGVNLWGDSCGPHALQVLADKHGLQLYFDSSDAFACEVQGAPIGGFGSLEVFSFHATQILNSMDGGCICTNDDVLAARLRNIRSSYGAGSPVEVVRTSNGRMSEAQAAVGLMNLEDLVPNMRRNKWMFDLYCAGLEAVPGAEVYLPQGVSVSNYQTLPCGIDSSSFGMSRNRLVEILLAENVIAAPRLYQGAHRSFPYQEMYLKYGNPLPHVDASCSRFFQLPLGAMVSDDDIHEICSLISAIHQNAGSLSSSSGE